MLDMAFIELHYAGRETWYVNVASISAVREISGESDPSDNGVWIYLKGDSQALKVSETVDEVFALINGVTVRGMVTESEHGGLHVKTGDGHSFPLRDLRLAKSFRIANEVDRT